MAFFGTNLVTIDQKGRFQFPANYRAELAQLCGEQMKVTLSAEKGCLLIYPAQGWDAEHAKLKASLLRGDDAWLSVFEGFMEEVAVDATGRFHISAALRGEANVEQAGAAKLIGRDSYFELWNAADLSAFIRGVRAQGLPLQLAQQPLQR